MHENISADYLKFIVSHLIRDAQFADSPGIKYQTLLAIDTIDTNVSVRTEMLFRLFAASAFEVETVAVLFPFISVSIKREAPSDRAVAEG